MNNQPLIQPLPPGQKKKAKQSFEVRTLSWSLWTRLLLVTQIFKVRKKKKIQIFRNFQITTLSKI